MIKTFLKKNLAIIILFILALFIRTYHLEKTLTFLEDEGRDMLISYRMLDTAHPVLLGPQTSTGDMYLGPFYYYFITPALLLFRYSPLGPAYLIALTGAITSVLMFLIAKKWFGVWSGYISGILYAIMPLPVVFTRNSWNPNLVPLVALLLLYLTIETIQNPKKQQSLANFFWLGISAGIIVQLHYMTLLYLGALGITFLVYHFKHLKNLLRGILIAIFGFFLMLTPFIVFEIRNDFVNTRAITRFVEADEVHNLRYSMPISLWYSKVSTTTTRVFASLFGKDALTPDPYRTSIALIACLLVLIAMISTLKNRSRSSSTARILFLILLIPLVLIGVYQENVHLHYLGFIFPLVYLVISSGFSFPKLRYLYLGGVLISITYSFPQLLSYLNSASTNQLVRAQEVVAYINNDAQGQPYNLVSNATTNTTPYQYFSAISSNPASTKKQNLVYLICLGNYCTESDISSTFLFITGPAHPSLDNYVGHPLYYQYDSPREVLSNIHVSNGVWVAKLLLK